MAFTTTYKTSRERIGQMRHRVIFYSPMISRTALGAEKITWATWVETWAKIEAGKTSEETEADRRTAFNTKRLIVRGKSVAGVTEKMVLFIDGDQYDIEGIQPYYDRPLGAYIEIIAKRKDKQISPVTPTWAVDSQFVEKDLAFTGTDWTIANGQLLDPGMVSEDDIHNRCYLYRSGLRQIYGVDFTIEPGNIIRFTLKCRNEVVLYQQFNPA